uniref:SRA stem-loop-interacting RNA-binding protein, mitochondrial n=1 Tax=Desmodus rotundus TaxID=9430 RepID=K9IXZ4_DESRO
MAASAIRTAASLRTSASRPVAFVRKIPWTAASSELREHFAQFGHVRKCTVPFDRETGFHRGMGWIQFSSEEELQNALQQDSHVIDGVKVNIFVIS